MAERGSAPAEFVMVSALLVTLVLGLMQVILVVHVRHTLLAAASEGARYAALADVSVAGARERTRALIEMSLSPAYSSQISAERSQTLGVPTALITITAPVPALGLWTVGGEMVVRAHAPLEFAR
jgi:Flp pilus assembly protein TadG